MSTTNSGEVTTIWSGSTEYGTDISNKQLSLEQYILNAKLLFWKLKENLDFLANFSNIGLSNVSHNFRDLYWEKKNSARKYGWNFQ